MLSDVGFDYWRLQCWSLTRAELGPGTSPLVSGVSDSLRFRSSENSWVTGVGGCCGVKTEDGPGRDWAMLSLGSSSVMSSQDCRSNRETQPWNNNNASLEVCVCVKSVSPETAVAHYEYAVHICLFISLTLSRSLGSRCSFSRSSLMWRLERKTRCASWWICRCWLSLSVSEITSLEGKEVIAYKTKCSKEK